LATKEDFHKLIDQIHDDRVLNAYFELIKRLNNSQTGDMWNNLSKHQQDELLLSYEESLYPENLMSYSLVKEQHKKWLKK